MRGDREAFGLHGRSAEQRIALDVLLDPDVGIVSLGGRAGTGKSALALCAGLEAVLERSQHRRVVVFRPLFAVGGQELGYLPGTENEKMNPWGQAVFDTLSAITTTEVVEEIVDRGMLEVLPLTHIRGRSLHDAFVIVDEAQSLERNVLLTVLSRIGQGSRVVLTHDVAQRDNLRVGRHDGIVAVVEKLKGHPLFAHVTLDAVRALSDRRPRHRDARGRQPLTPSPLVGAGAMAHSSARCVVGWARGVPGLPDLPRPRHGPHRGRGRSGHDRPGAAARGHDPAADAARRRPARATPRSTSSLISHLHHDHLDLPSLRMLRDDPLIVVPQGAERLDAQQGLRQRHRDGARGRAPLTRGDGDAPPSRCTPASGSRVARWRSPSGYLIEAGPATVYFAGDTDLFPGMADLDRRGARRRPDPRVGMGSGARATGT